MFSVRFRALKLTFLQQEVSKLVNLSLTDTCSASFYEIVDIRFQSHAKHISFTKKKSLWARSIQPKFRPVRPGKVDHLKRWTSFFETFPVGPNRSIEFWTEISGNFGRMDRAL